MHDALSLTAICTAGALATALAGWSRLLTLALGMAVLALPFVLRFESRGLHGFSALGAAWIFFRTVDYARRRDIPSTGYRIWQVFSPFEVDRVKSAPARIDVRLILTSLGYFAITAVGLYVATRGSWILRWLGGAVFAYASIDAVVRLIVAGYRLVGLELPPLHDRPVLSRTIAEFWGERWNKTVNGFLKRHCFMPLARRGHVILGLAFAFVASTLLHFYFVWASIGLTWGAVMGAFFVLQLPLIGLERLLKVARWPAWAGRAWTITILTCASPLFIEPFLRVLSVPMPP
jgi:hypothetical protein